MHLVLEAPGSHLFPGSKGEVSVQDGSFLRDRPQPCIVAFSDGSIAHGLLQPQKAAIFQLRVDPYMTSKRTPIAAKTWIVELAERDDGSLDFRVRSRGAQNGSS